MSMVVCQERHPAHKNLLQQIGDPPYREYSETLAGLIKIAKLICELLEKLCLSEHSCYHIYWHRSGIRVKNLIIASAALRREFCVKITYYNCNSNVTVWFVRWSPARSSTGMEWSCAVIEQSSHLELYLTVCHIVHYLHGCLSPNH